MGYRNRYVEDELGSRLKRAGAVLIRGPKGCGKTETARYFAKSETVIDASPNTKNIMTLDPKLLLAGDTPHLLDEWQEQPDLWNYVRHEVDNRKLKGQFILTGSATPNDDAKLHSGVGRFSIMQMRPMSLFESGKSSGEVSLKAILAGEKIGSNYHEANIPHIVDNLIRGGWPGIQELDIEDARLSVLDMLELITEVDISKISTMKRDPIKVKRLMSSIARNISNEVKIETIAKDAGLDGSTLSYDTVRDYVDALERLMIIEDLPAWNTHIRSSATLRKSRKRHFVDPSIAIAALGINGARLQQDFEYMGYVFESLAIRDLRIYAQTMGAKLFHYRDSSGREVDAILEMPDGSWAAFEIKLGFGAAEDGIQSLLKFLENVDTEKVGKPKAMAVITGSGVAATHESGVQIVPLSALCA
ncbi:ATPase [Bacteroidia bacterium]|nr:ATPase [Bacteroidia bacterium]